MMTPSSSWRDLMVPTWTIAFAMVALLDMSTCWAVLLGGWDERRKESEKQTPRKGLNLDFLKFGRNPDEMMMDNMKTCPVTNDMEGCQRFVFPFWNVSIAVIFCVCCVIEAVHRAREARQIALENEALDIFEKKLAKLYSTTKSNFLRLPRRDGIEERQQSDFMLVRNTLRLWTPVASILFVWFILLPWTFGKEGCGNDTALATIWIRYSMRQLAETLDVLQDELWSMLWNVALPSDQFLLHPKRLFQRIRDILRWIRYFRFAGPLLRLILKLQDQIWVFTKTWRQSWQAQAEKGKRMRRRSMLFDDMQRIESLAKVQTALASIPSQLIHLAHEASDDIGNLLNEKREQSKKLRRRLDSLKNDISKRASIYPSSELYDQIVDLTQELKRTVGTAILSSHLISPRSRFSVGWRMIVTFCLCSELSRLYFSWQLSGTFQVSMTEMLSSLLVECDQNMMERFRFLTRQGQPIRRLVGKLFRLPNVEYADCMPTSPASKLFLSMGAGFESAIDIVCFLDIFVWFFTGELDVNAVVIPKPFFSRCILPGTLVQVLDHPTLPDALPLLIADLVNAASAVGYSRVIRWALALYPAVQMILVDPTKSYLFRSMEEDEYLKYTESLVLIPNRFSSAALFRESNVAALREPTGLRSHKSAGLLAFSYPSVSGNLDGSLNSLEDSFSMGYSLGY